MRRVVEGACWAIVVLFAMGCGESQSVEPSDDSEVFGSVGASVETVNLGHWEIVQDIGAPNNDVIAIHAALTRYGDVVYFSGSQYTSADGDKVACNQTGDTCVLPEPRRFPCEEDLDCIGFQEDEDPSDLRPRRACIDDGGGDKYCEFSCAGGRPCPGNRTCTGGVCQWPEGGGRCVKDVSWTGSEISPQPEACECTGAPSSCACHCNLGYDNHDGYRVFTPGSGVDSDSDSIRFGSITVATPPPMSGPDAFSNGSGAFDWDTFCAGHTWDAFGNLVVAGGMEVWPNRLGATSNHRLGNLDQDPNNQGNPLARSHFTGSKRAALYVPSPGGAGAWANLQDMPAGRWYPTLLNGVTAGNTDGRIFSMSGHPHDLALAHDNPAVETLPSWGADTSDAWESYATFDTGGFNRYYPRAWVVPPLGGSVFITTKRHQAQSICANPDPTQCNGQERDHFLTDLDVEIGAGGELKSIGNRLSASPPVRTLDVGSRPPEGFFGQSTNYSGLLLPFECQVPDDTGEACHSDQNSFYPTKVILTNAGGTYVKDLDAFGLSCVVTADCPSTAECVGQVCVPTWEATAPREGFEADPVLQRHHGIPVYLPTGQILLTGGITGGVTVLVRHQQCDESENCVNVEGQNLGECDVGATALTAERGCRFNADCAPDSLGSCIGGKCELRAPYDPNGGAANDWAGRCASDLQFVEENETPNGAHSAVSHVEMYDPDTNEWFVGARSQTLRQYHSTAMLLADGRVWTAGSSIQSAPAFASGERRELAMEIFTPWYFNHPDAPVILDDGLELHACQNSVLTIPIASGDASEIVKASLVRNGSITHAFDMDSRLIFLQVEAINDNELQVRLPKQTRVAPAGNYTLFVMKDNAGGGPGQTLLPSKGRAVQFFPTEPQPPQAELQPPDLDLACDLAQGQRT